MPLPPVTVVIATHSRHALLLEAVDSVLAQTLSAAAARTTLPGRGALRRPA